MMTFAMKRSSLQSHRCTWTASHHAGAAASPQRVNVQAAGLWLMAPTLCRAVVLMLVPEWHLGGNSSACAGALRSSVIGWEGRSRSLAQI